ncbi:MAG: ComF family protein [Clostridiales bacterium]|nr:ComF family protein [Clostridiales bacterium]
MMNQKIKNAATSALSFLFPSVCINCGRVLIERGNCGIKTKELQICTSCLCKLPVRLSTERWFPCLSEPYGDDPIPDFSVWALFHYEMPVTLLVKRLKFFSEIYCGQLLADLMGREFPKNTPVKWDAVVPVPLSEKRLRKRGYNQAEVLAKGLSEHLGVPLCNNVIRKVRHTKQQSRYQDPQQRSQNVQGAYAVDENWDITGWNIILVDDILTTGATLHEAAKVLFENGASAVVGAVCATHRENIEN